jgi:hypothetical protein
MLEHTLAFGDAGALCIQEVLRGGFLLLVAHKVADRLSHRFFLFEPALLNIGLEHGCGLCIKEAEQWPLASSDTGLPGLPCAFSIRGRHGDSLL